MNPVSVRVGDFRKDGRNTVADGSVVLSIFSEKDFIIRRIRVVITHEHQIIVSFPYLKIGRDHIDIAHPTKSETRARFEDLFMEEISKRIKERMDSGSEECPLPQ